ncbi:MAG TPA: FAD-dependent oxidoreductase [Flavisolibacter sp.]|nr:FAD-dependent oxidoreductase [Flavisolibacter sp.]
MNRRDFIQDSLALIGLTAAFASCQQKEKAIKGKIMGASAHVGHMLRDASFTTPAETIQKDIVIVGGGVSGLSAARFLQKQGVKDFLLLDLEENVGGNAASGNNVVSAFPWGAHYIPIPNNSLQEYQDFLTEVGVITGRNQQGLPIYNEYHLCFDPQERLYINGRWQEGLIPHLGVPEADQKQIERFLSLMDTFRNQVGKDGKEAFALPVDRSSKDEAFVMLDQVTMNEWLDRQQLTSPYLHWYINYCTKDDFGTTIQNISAWAGIHYFASRKGKGANAEHHDVLTWPAGNGWLVEQLQKDINGHILTQSMAISLKQEVEGIVVHYYDVRQKSVKAIKAKQCILAIPQFVAARLLKDNQRIGKVQQHLHYTPWMVANLTVTKLEERTGAPLSWDNVIYESDSLGYINAAHELLDQHVPKRNLTYYLPLTKGAPLAERKAAQQTTHEQWVAMIIADLKRVHPDIEEKLEEINVMVWGHAMTQPRPGLIHGPIRQELGASIKNNIHFAHTDLAGVSLFEEAFYQGLSAARKVLNQLA